MITTKDEFARAFERLRRRDPEALAAFIMSLAHGLGPIGEQVRTFIVADDVAETADSLRRRIRGLGVPTEYDHRHARGKEIGASLALIVESIESLVLPVNPQLAFDLLVAVFEADGTAMENCGDHHWEVECAFERAAGVMAEAGKSLPAAEVKERIQALMAVDSYGVRKRLKAVGSIAGVGS
jgi:hypothetical protein